MRWSIFGSAGFSPFWRLLLMFIVMSAIGVYVSRQLHEPPAPVAAGTTATTLKVHTGGRDAPRAVQSPDADSARFLAQATFGPTLADIATVNYLGYSHWIDAQFAEPMSSQLRYIRQFGTYPAPERRLDAWFVNALGGEDPLDPSIQHRDQLRQRVAFALSEIFVVSDAHVDKLRGQPQGMTDYYDTLAGDAFGNFRQLLEDVTLHPVMGMYLSMLGNQKPDTANNIRPDENYAREVLQLFSVGLVRLKPNGTPLLDDDGDTIPSYTQDTVKGFAHVFTGYTFNGCKGSYSFADCYAYDADPGWLTPMQSWDEYHASAESKQLLDYPGVETNHGQSHGLNHGLLPAGGSAQSDLKAALDNIFYHPNVGPFIGKQLIQRLVTSNPSPAYVGRVAAAFNDNGAHVRGDMKAVVRAILLDPEARKKSSQPSDFGKAREPLLRLMHLWRSMDAQILSGKTDQFWVLDGSLQQSPMYAPSVFNFFRPDYIPTGEPTQLGVMAPELQLATDYMLPTTENFLASKLFDNYLSNPDIGPDGIYPDLERDVPLASTPGALLDRYNLLFMSGQMSSSMRNILLTRLNAMPNANHDDRLARVQEALYLIINSPEYIVQK